MKLPWKLEGCSLATWMHEISRGVPWQHERKLKEIQWNSKEHPFQHASQSMEFRYTPKGYPLQTGRKSTKFQWDALEYPFWSERKSVELWWNPNGVHTPPTSCESTHLTVITFCVRHSRCARSHMHNMHAFHQQFLHRFDLHSYVQVHAFHYSSYIHLHIPLCIFHMNTHIAETP